MACGVFEWFVISRPAHFALTPQLIHSAVHRGHTLYPVVNKPFSSRWLFAIYPIAMRN